MHDWYDNLQGMLHAKIKSNLHNRIPASITLWQAWQTTQAKWDQFKQAFQVGTCCRFAAGPSCLQLIHACVLLHCRTMAETGRKSWPGHVHNVCSEPSWLACTSPQ